MVLTGQNVQRFQTFAIFTSYLTGILKCTLQILFINMSRKHPDSPRGTVHKWKLEPVLGTRISDYFMRGFNYAKRISISMVSISTKNDQIT